MYTRLALPYALQVSRGDVIELEEEMTISELAKKLKTNPGKSASDYDETKYNNYTNFCVLHVTMST